VALMMDERISLQHWWNDTDGGKYRSTCPGTPATATLFTTNPTLSGGGEGSNPGLRGERPATDAATLKAISITYSECVCGLIYGMCMCCVVVCGLSVSTIFVSILSHKLHNFREEFKDILLKM
jgi:hypothetical protein